MNPSSPLIEVLVAALILAGCGGERSSQPVDAKPRTAAPQQRRPPSANRVPVRVGQPSNLDLNTIQEIQALKVEVTAELEITVDASGKASEVRVVSVEPPDNATASKFASMMAEAYRAGEYTIPPGESAPYVITMTVSSGDPTKPGRRPR